MLHVLLAYKMTDCPIKKLEDIDILYNLFEELRKEYDINLAYVQRNRDVIIQMRNKMPFVPTPPKFSKLETAKFDIKEFWMDTLIRNFQQNIDIVRMRTQELIKFLISLGTLANVYSIDLPPLVPPLVDTEKCKNCTESILPCKLHPKVKEHHTHYLNTSELARLPEPKVIAVDVECVQTIKDYTHPEKKAQKIAFRIAAFANVKSKNPESRKIQLIYHSFWKPDTRYFKSYKEKSGIDADEIRQNMDKLYDRKEANRKFKKYIAKGNILIFNDAKDDVKCLNISEYKEIRDIQTYFCRYPYLKPGSNKPVALKTLSKYILWSNIQENSNPVHHCPVVDARHTLHLYFKIPKEHWEPKVLAWPEFQPDNIAKTTLTTTIESVHEEMEIEPIASTSGEVAPRKTRNLNYDDFNSIDFELDFEPNYESDEELYYSFK